MRTVCGQIAAAGEKGCPAKDVQQARAEQNDFPWHGMNTEACGVEGPRVTTLLTALTAVLETKFLQPRVLGEGQGRKVLRCSCR